MRINLRDLRTNLWFQRLVAGFVAIILLVFLSFFSFRFLWRGKILPGVTVSGMSIGGLTPQRATEILSHRTDAYVASPFPISVDDHSWFLSSPDLDLTYDIASSVDAAFSSGRGGAFFGAPSLARLLTQGEDHPLRYEFNEAALSASISAIAAEVERPSISPSLSVLKLPHPQTGSRIDVQEGEAGRFLDTAAIRRQLYLRFATLSYSPVTVPTQTVFPTPQSADPVLTRMRGESLLTKRVVLSYAEGGPDPLEWELGGEELVHFLSFDGAFDQQKIASYSAILAESIDRPPENATFEFREGRVIEFAPEKNGLALNIQDTTAALIGVLDQLETSEEDETTLILPITETKAAITTAQVNDLGIRELLGRGVSTFHGSIANREYNISLASARLAGILVPPGEVFSFNESVGDISAATGYRQAYIIKDGRTILGDGGGVCQVSTTLFRAALDAGLPITARTAHSYRVTYYEQNQQAGFDATVFAPSVDLTFLNDTPGHLLIQAQADTVSNTLVFELYGTSDGRASTITNYRLWDVSPPPPDLYQDDPTLPAGTVKQVDWKAWGAKVKFDYSVSRGGETIFEKTFYSNFRPWQSVFLRGTAP